jgi:hypothetical protein
MQIAANLIGDHRNHLNFGRQPPTVILSAVGRLSETHRTLFLLRFAEDLASARSRSKLD